MPYQLLRSASCRRTGPSIDDAFTPSGQTRPPAGREVCPLMSFQLLRSASCRRPGSPLMLSSRLRCAVGPNKTARRPPGPSIDSEFHVYTAATVPPSRGRAVAVNLKPWRRPRRDPGPAHSEGARSHSNLNWVCAVRSSRAGRRVALVVCRQCVCSALGPRLSRAARFCGCVCVWRFMVLPLPRTNTRRVFCARRVR